MFSVTIGQNSCLAPAQGTDENRFELKRKKPLSVFWAKIAVVLFPTLTKVVGSRVDCIESRKGKR